MSTENHEVSASKFVPGVVQCSVCNFRKTYFNLHKHNAAVTARDVSGETMETCPNGCAPLSLVTWEQHAANLEKDLEHFAERAVRAERAVAAATGAFPNNCLEFTDEDFTRIVDSMPSGPLGFCSSWGYVTFSRKLIEEIKAKAGGTVDGKNLG